MNGERAAGQADENDAVCPHCEGREWQPAYVTLDSRGRVAGLAYPLTCIACGMVRTMPVGGYPAFVQHEVNQSLRERIERAQRLTAVPRPLPGEPTPAFEGRPS